MNLSLSFDEIIARQKGFKSAQLILLYYLSTMNDQVRSLMNKQPLDVLAINETRLDKGIDLCYPVVDILCKFFRT